MKDRLIEMNYAKWLPKNKHGEVLDLGCGEGPFFDYLFRAGFDNCTGLDKGVHPDRFNSYGYFTFKTANPSAFLKARPGFYTLILCRNFLDYFSFEEASDLLFAAKLALKKGGRLIIENYNGAVLTSPYVESKDCGGIKIRIGDVALNRMLLDSGLAVDGVFEFRSTGFLWNALNFLYKKFLKAIYIMERGVSDENPTCYSTRIIGVATRV